jgi:spermidine synthase
MTGKFEDLSYEQPFVVLNDGVRSLHFTYGEVQSSMRVAEPDELEIDYTRTMMGFLLLTPQPRNITMIGLGGGSLVKFCHRHLSSARVTVVEINPGVIALRREFGIPDDDARLSVIADDGALYMQRELPPIEVLLVDAFDYSGQSPQICSQAFYDDCFRRLAAGGVMAVNLHVDHPEYDFHLERIARSFKGNAVQAMAEEEGNSIVFAARGRPATVQALRSGNHDAPTALKREFDRIGWCASGLPVSALVPRAARR